MKGFWYHVRLPLCPWLPRYKLDQSIPSIVPGCTGCMVAYCSTVRKHLGSPGTVETSQIAMLV